MQWTHRFFSGTFVAIVIVTAVSASLASRTIARFQEFYIALNALYVRYTTFSWVVAMFNLFARLCLGIIVALPSATPQEFKNSASYVFGTFSNRE